jgi:aminopeptidase N
MVSNPLHKHTASDKVFQCYREWVYPLVFSQCQAILTRTLLPCQDTHAVKATYEARVHIQQPFTAVMSASQPHKQE